MGGTPYQKTVSLSLPTAVANGIAQSQSGTAATPLTLNGSLVTAGVANLVKAQRVIVTSAGNDSTNIFTIVGTDTYGRVQTEALKGANTAAAQTSRDFLTVTSITPTNNTAAAVTSGTVNVGSTIPMIVDALVNSAIYGVSTTVTGTVNYTVEKSSDDLGPNYDFNTNVVTWYPAPSFTAQTTSVDGEIQGPCNFIRLTINSGAGTVVLRVIMPFLAGR